MHKLNRPIQPRGLGQFAHGRNVWGDVLPVNKTEIWQSIDAMQQKRCAYCEIDIQTDRAKRNAHIEHFRQRSNYPQGTFQWANIFGSCNRQDSCGKHKDGLPAYDHQDLIKMDAENPEQFLKFSPDGNVIPAKGLTHQEEHRAKETIRIFNLNGALRQIRKNAVKGYIQTAEELASYAEEFEESDWRPLLEDELEKTASMPFATAIRHVLLTCLREHYK